MATNARLWTWLLCVACLTATTNVALAQAEDEFSLDEEGDTQADAIAKKPTQGTPSGDEEDAEAVLIGDEQALEEERNPQEEYRKSTDPYEDPDKKYFFIGANWRFLYIPSGILEAAMEAAPGVGAAGSFFGEFAYRKDGFQVAADIGWQKFHLSGPFQLAGDPETDTEMLDGPFNLLVATATVTWSTPFADWFSLDYGIEAGIMALFGDLKRSEAYRGSDGKWRTCPSWVGSDLLPNATDQGQNGYCAPPLTPDGGPPPSSLLTNEAGEDGEHYGVTADKGLFNGGVPRVLPILGGRLSLRFKPIKQLVLRVDWSPSFPFGPVSGGLAALYGW